MNVSLRFETPSPAPVGRREARATPLAILDDVLAPSVCRALIAEADVNQWLTSTAEIRRTSHGLCAPERIDGNPPSQLVGAHDGRPRFAVIDAPLLALRLFYRLVGALPLSLGGAELSGLKPMFRCTEYRCGEGTRQHRDPARETKDGQRSRLSVLVFLNRGYGGGEVEFPELDHVVEPRVGRVCVFPHDLVHIDRVVSSGRKFVLETEVFYDDEWLPYAG